METARRVPERRWAAVVGHTAMRKLLVCQHVPFEILGTLDPLLRNVGFRIRYVNFGRRPDAQPSLDGYAGMVILGGPMNVDQTSQYPHLLTEFRLVEEALRMQIPVLGICLGAQVIAKTLGAEVKRNGEKEIGWYDVTLTNEGRKDSILRHFRDTEKVFQWHGDSFGVPRTAKRLAVSSGCRNQAFRFGSNVYGFQFHLEVDGPLIERWLRVPAHRKELESLKGRIAQDNIRKETAVHVDGLKRLSDRTFGEFVKLFGIRKRRLAHPSR